MEIHVTIRGEEALVEVQGTLNETEGETLIRSLDTLMIQGFREIVLDLLQVPSMSVGALTRLVDHWGLVKFHRGKITLKAVHPRLIPLLRTMGLEEWLNTSLQEVV